jgi:hypothetical protein
VTAKEILAGQVHPPAGAAKLRQALESYVRE